MRIRTTILISALFLVACAGGKADGPEAAFQAYRQAIRDGDFEALKPHLTEDGLGEIEKFGGDQALGMISAMLPKDESIAAVRVEGDSATLDLQSGDGAAKGTVTMRREGGVWKVEKERWQRGVGAGTPGQPPKPEKPKLPPLPDDWKPATAWTDDPAKAEIPGGLASGLVGGRPFRVAEAELQGNILTLRDGDLFDRKAEITVFLFPNGEDESLEGRTFEFDPEQGKAGDTSAHVHLAVFREEGQAPEMSSKMSDYVLKLAFGKAADGHQPVRIHLSYPDEAKSFVAGELVATVR